ncbi:MAG: hypothetical protein HY391_05910 [Deltaproteobacteria bacterium]|nr:hypothetical protein [Deltaproteobacteria bacterium]
MKRKIFCFGVSLLLIPLLTTCAPGGKEGPVTTAGSTTITSGSVTAIFPPGPSGTVEDLTPQVTAKGGHGTAYAATTEEVLEQIRSATPWPDMGKILCAMRIIVNGNENYIFTLDPDATQGQILQLLCSELKGKALYQLIPQPDGTFVWIPVSTDTTAGVFTSNVSGIFAIAEVGQTAESPTAQNGFITNTYAALSDLTIEKITFVTEPPVSPFNIDTIDGTITAGQTPFQKEHKIGLPGPGGSLEGLKHRIRVAIYIKLSRNNQVVARYLVGAAYLRHGDLPKGFGEKTFGDWLEIYATEATKALGQIFIKGTAPSEFFKGREASLPDTIAIAGVAGVYECADRYEPNRIQLKPDPECEDGLPVQSMYVGRCAYSAFDGGGQLTYDNLINFLSLADALKNANEPNVQYLQPQPAPPVVSYLNHVPDPNNFTQTVIPTAVGLASSTTIPMDFSPYFNGLPKDIFPDPLGKIEVVCTKPAAPGATEGEDCSPGAEDPALRCVSGLTCCKEVIHDPTTSAVTGFKCVCRSSCPAGDECH